MEKKGSRSVQTSAKGNVTESKKVQDVSGGKLWPRGGRRREPPGGTLPTKNEPSRKPIPQRNKTIDKRPRARGSNFSGAFGGKEDTRLDIQEAELGSVFVQGSKKQSLNHLLNFHYNVPRDTHWQSGRGGSNKIVHRGLGTQKHKYNKEHFLQANCQFIVNVSGDYKQYMNNPDALVNWDLIEQVNVQVTDFPSCPICLYSPVAAKMTRCGHIYCWSCMLHYLALSDKTWRKCPICFEAVHKRDLKSVVAIPHSLLNVNDQITFRLMKRARGCLTAYPAIAETRSDDALFNMSDTKAKNIYSKLLVADTPEILSIIQREQEELELALADDMNSPERCFVDEAIAQLKERENFVLNSLNVDLIKREESKMVEESLCRKNSVEDVACGDGEMFEDEDQLDNSFAAEDLDISNGNGGQQPSKYFYFYQESDGQHIYLHALNVRMLEHTYGSLEHCPATLVGRIVEKEGGSMTEELRKRLRYLQHLPVTCQFEVAEIQMKSPVVTKETLGHFSDQIEIRRKRRHRRARDEKRREKRIVEEENRKMGKYPTANIHIDSHQQFPEFGFEATLDDQRRTESESTNRSDGSSSLSLDVPIVGSLNESECSGGSGMSFAQMLSAAKPRPDTWPGLKPSASSSPSQAPVKYINVTSPKLTGFTRLRRDSDDEVDVESYVPAPVFNQSFGDAIAMALEKASLGNDTNNGSEGGKKSKKKKNKVILSTRMGCSGN